MPASVVGSSLKSTLKADFIVPPIQPGSMDKASQPILVKRSLSKRLFDIIFSFMALMAILPVMLFIALCIKVASPTGPVFYGHQRVGRGGTPFNCYKFRTMVPNAAQRLEELLNRDPKLRQEYEQDFKLKHDPRIIPVIGHFLRKTSLDELPQFFNTLIGNMSVVGPRPIVTDEMPKYGNKIEELLKIKPGVSGLWQVSGRNNVSYKKRIAMDVYYIRNHNFLLDVRIIFKTLYVMLFQRGAY